VHSNSQTVLSCITVMSRVTQWIIPFNPSILPTYTCKGFIFKYSYLWKTTPASICWTTEVNMFNIRPHSISLFST